MKKDNESIINEMLLKNYDKYYRIALGYVRTKEDAMDVVQEGAYKAIYHAKGLKKQEYADTWICRIMINEALELLRRDRKDYEVISEYEQGEEAVYEDIDLRNAIDQLLEQERTVVVLRYFEDMSLEQVAHVTGENLNTVKSRLYRALRKLRITLEEK